MSLENEPMSDQDIENPEMYRKDLPEFLGSKLLTDIRKASLGFNKKTFFFINIDYKWDRSKSMAIEKNEEQEEKETTKEKIKDLFSPEISPSPKKGRNHNNSRKMSIVTKMKENRQNLPSESVSNTVIKSNESRIKVMFNNLKFLSFFLEYSR